MNFNKHYELKDKHSFLSASKYHWINYDEATLFERYSHSYDNTIGTLVHELAASLIQNKIKLNKGDHKIVLLHLLNNGIPRDVIDMERIYSNLANYVNDSIGFRMVPEQILKYSDLAFATTDAINSLEEIFKTKRLRIHDLKTGSTPAHIEQLKVYAAYFCLEYNVKPSDLDIELRIYQNDDIIGYIPEVDEIFPIMDKIVTFNKIMTSIAYEEV